MDRLSVLCALFTTTLILSEFTVAVPNEDALRLKRSPQMPEMPHPPAPPGGFPSPPMPFKRIVRQLPKDIPEGPPGEMPHLDIEPASWVHSPARVQREVHETESEAMKRSRSYPGKQNLSIRNKREARGTGGKLSTRGG